MHILTPANKKASLSNVHSPGFLWHIKRVDLALILWLDRQDTSCHSPSVHTATQFSLVLPLGSLLIHFVQVTGCPSLSHSHSPSWSLSVIPREKVSASKLNKNWFSLSSLGSGRKPPRSWHTCWLSSYTRSSVSSSRYCLPVLSSVTQSESVGAITHISHCSSLSWYIMSYYD